MIEKRYFERHKVVEKENRVWHVPITEEGTSGVRMFPPPRQSRAVSYSSMANVWWEVRAQSQPGERYARCTPAYTDGGAGPTCRDKCRSSATTADPPTKGGRRGGEEAGKRRRRGDDDEEADKWRRRAGPVGGGERQAAGHVTSI